MWLTFALAVAVGAAFLYVPGYVVLRAFRFSRAASFACAPLITLFGYPIVCIVNERLGTFSFWATVAGPVLAFGVVALCVSVAAARARGRRWLAEPRIDLGMGYGASLPGGRFVANMALFALSAFVGLFLGYVVFASQLDSPDAIFQWFDNVHHLSQVRSYLDSGQWSPLSSSMYLSAADAAFDPYGPSGFYPSTWHCVVAMMAGATGASVAVATNAAVIVFTCIVFPVSMCAFLRMLFPESAGTAALGAFCCLACSVFPWGFSIAGPIYPNLAATSVAPAVAAAFVSVFETGRRRRRKARAAALALFLAGVVGVAFAHPNVPFSLAVLLAPFFVLRVCDIVRASALPVRARRAATLGTGVALAAAICALWYVLFSLPFLHDVVSYDWPAFKSFGWAVADALFANFRETTPNYLFGLFVFAGIARTLLRRERRWLVVSYAAAVGIYVVAASGSGFAKHLLAGFWYTDFYRLGATVLLAGIPLAAFGMAGVVRVAARLADRARSRMRGAREALDDRQDGSLVVGARGVAMEFAGAPSPRHLAARTAVLDAPRGIVWAGIAIALLSLAVWTLPVRPYMVFRGDTRSQLQVVADRVSDQYSYESPAIYSADERAFVHEVERIVEPGALIVNEPNDGTMFAYGADGLNVMFRYLYGDDTTYDATCIRTRLNHVADNSAVRDAVERTGARYVIQLDHHARPEPLPIERPGQPSDAGSGLYMFSYIPQQWAGIDAVSDYTPGFELVLSRGDMRLYRILGSDEVENGEGD